MEGRTPINDRTTVRLRIELDGTQPPVWRLVEVPATLGLDGLHEVIQVAFGWQDAHLHRFTTVDDVFGRRDYLCPFEVAERVDGEPEEQVRVLDVVAGVGDDLQYLYDFGDGWSHAVEVVEVVADPDRSGRVTCLDGARPGPPEDCGGPYGYELVVAAQDPDHPAHADAVAEFAAMYGAEVDPSWYRVVPFDVEVVNAELAGLDPRSPFAMEQLDGPVAEFLRGMHQPLVRRRLRTVLADAELDTAADPDAATAAGMVEPYRWLVDRVGSDGIALTGAGYLPPVHVSAAMDELGMADEWIGKGNREDLTWPVLHLRTSARRLGLVRVHRKRLVATANGRQLLDDPVGLWRHLARRMPMGTPDDAGYTAGMVALAMVAAGSTDGLDALVAQALSSRWSEADGRPLRPRTAHAILRDDLDVLRRLGATSTSDAGGRDHPTAEGRGFARMALVLGRSS